MTKPIKRDPIYRRRRYPVEIMELCVRWYITYRLSYRDLVAMMAERGVAVSHTTILRWVLRYVPEFEKRWARYARPVNASWRVDETAVSVRGGKHYLYRAVDKKGRSVDHLLCADRSRDAARAFFRKAVITHATEWPRTVNLDGNMGSHRALRGLRKEDPRWEGVIVRKRRYLNNIVEQDHRAIKRRCASMLGFKSFRTAALALDGIELAHRIRKGQFSISGGDQHGLTSLKLLWDRALADVDSTDVDARNALACQPTANAPEPTFAAVNRVRRIRKPGRPIRRRPQARKFSDGDGLYLLVSPAGGQHWRYNYRFNGKQKTLALGSYPGVPIAMARVRHLAAWKLLAAGNDPSLWRRELRTAAAADIANPVDPAQPFGRIAAASHAR
jgi:transposase-like protein